MPEKIFGITKMIFVINFILKMFYNYYEIRRDVLIFKIRVILLILEEIV
jgi:hypothetical protein